jgi:hypothetical protein
MRETREELRTTLEQLRPAVGAFDRWNRNRERRERIRRAGVSATALVIGVVAVSVMFLSVRGSSEAGTRPLAGGPSVDVAMGAGEYYYQHLDGGPEVWWALDDSGRIRNADGDEQTYGPGEFPSDSGDVSGLSTDPAELERQLRQRVEPTGASPEPYQSWFDECGCQVEPGQEGPITWGLVRSIRELLEAPDVTPEQKVALFQVAWGLDGMTVTGDATDPAGRSAILLSIDTEQILHRWWFDPASLQLMATRDQAAHYLVTETIQSAGFTDSTETSETTRVLVADQG